MLSVHLHSLTIRGSTVEKQQWLFLSKRNIIKASVYVSYICADVCYLLWDLDNYTGESELNQHCLRNLWWYALFISPSFVYVLPFVSNPALFIQYHPILAFQFNWQSVKKNQTNKHYFNGRGNFFNLIDFFFRFLLLNISTIITQEILYSPVNTHWPCCHTILDRSLKFSPLTWKGFHIDLYKYK